MIKVIGKLFAGQSRRLIEVVLGGPIFFQTLHTACDLGLFTLLRRKPGLSIDQIAAELGIQRSPAQVLVTTCVALGVVKKAGSRYRIARLVWRFFEPDGPWSMLPMLEWMHHITYPSLFHFSDAVREGRAAGLDAFPGGKHTLYEVLAENDQLRTVFYDAMSALWRISNPRLLRRIDFSRFHRILDVGGGTGDNLMAIAGRHPNVRGTVFELPAVAEMANERFAQANLSSRLEAIGGNVFEDELPRGCDCVLFCRFTSNHSEETNRRLLKKTFAAIEPGGMVCIFTSFLNDDLTGPLGCALLSPYFLCTVNGQTRVFSWQETASWLEEAGFVDITRVPMVPREGALLAFKR